MRQSNAPTNQESNASALRMRPKVLWKFVLLEWIFTRGTRRLFFDVVRADVKNGLTLFLMPSIGSHAKFDVDVKILTLALTCFTQTTPTSMCVKTP